MISQEIRRKFLHYFKTQGHRVVPSSPVVPHDDPTLLFTNAGMNQFKDVFLGHSQRDYRRAVTTQKCVRVGGKHNDLENVGHTSRHLTLFEMIGNFSFGDYFKKQAIAYAWDVVTHVFGFDPKKIWVSVYQEDDEAFALWEAFLPAERIVRFGEKENFWAMGETGPCGPCSELLFDRGAQYGAAPTPYDDPSGERYLEFWNLVFMQFLRDSSGVMTPLPQQSIDTGAGLERIVSLSMGVDSVFQTDILRGLIAQVEEVSGVRYEEKNLDLAPSFHVIADHIRSLSFAIADGAQPSPTDRGYVLRKILRRAVRYGKGLGLQRPFLADVLPRLVDLMGEDFPELRTSQQRIAEILTLEEEAFLRTLQRGGNLLQQVVQTSKKNARISGGDLFKLKDTYGFPLEEMLLIAKDEHLEVDVAQFHRLEEEAKERSKKARKTEEQSFDLNFFKDYAATHRPTEFLGYHQLQGETEISALLIGDRFVDEMREGDEGMFLLPRTPFYAEMGGQIGDTGYIECGAARFLVTDTRSPFPGIVVHVGVVETGLFRKGEKVMARVDTLRRQNIQNNHTATHLLHWALQKILGPHIKQAGSLVEEGRLRFDFNHHKAVTLEELRQIEELVNGAIRSDASVKNYELSYEEAQKHAEIKQFFGEKYGSKVRVIDLGFSKELCGGTHTHHVGTIGLFKILKEGSIAAGVRRVEAVTALYAERMVQENEDRLRQLATRLKTSTSSLEEKIESLLQEERRLREELGAARRGQLQQIAGECLQKKEAMGKTHWVASLVDVAHEELVPLSEEILHQMRSGIVLLGVAHPDRCQLLIRVSADLSFDAGQLVKEVAPLIRGGGGGNRSLAQAGGKDGSQLQAAFAAVRRRIAPIA